ncbi:MAG TPA: trigger factor, partial [Pirellulales bacterium]
MATTEDDETGAAAITAEGADSTPAEGDESAEEKKLHLEVNIDARSACERHVTVSISREDIDRYYNDAYSEMMGKAVVPGFRAGRAPRKLVELRFRKDVGDQIKNTLLMDSLTQLSEEGKFSPISEPDIDPLAISLPDEGPMKFEFNIEVRPEFDLPQWKGLKINRPVREFTDKDIERQMKEILARHGRLVPHDGPAEAGDYVTVNLRFKDGENVISEFKEQVLNVRAVLSFRDGKIEGFDKLMQGAAAGERRTGQARLTEDAPNETLRGKM